MSEKWSLPRPAVTGVPATSRLPPGILWRFPDGKLIADLDAFDGHVRRFMERVPNYTDWKVEKAAITPRHTPETRKAAEGKGYIPQDLIDLTEGL